MAGMQFTVGLGATLAVAATGVGLTSTSATAAEVTMAQQPIAMVRGDIVNRTGGITGSPSVTGGVIYVRTVKVAKPNNREVGIVPFTDAVYPSCTGVSGCMTIGKVKYSYGISKYEVTVKQYVTFLNTVDPTGKDKYDLYSATESSSAWPKYGQINYSKTARYGAHYRVSYPQWAAKPYGFADFLRAARFANSVQNGQVFSKSTKNGVTTYGIRLSSSTTKGMYNLNRRRATRSHAKGFVIPSQNEWIKAAYYDPNGGGKYGYWKYPTNPGVFGDGTATQPNQVLLSSGRGNVTNSSAQPLANDLVNAATPPTWCPFQYQPASACNTKNPLGLSAATYQTLYKASLGTIGQAKTKSPWGTLDQGGNAVEWTDTITPAPTGTPTARIWRRLHGGVPNSTAYQMWPSAVGLQPQDNKFYERTYPWLGFRLGAIGNK